MENLNTNNTVKIEEVTTLIENILKGNYGEWYYLETESYINDFLIIDRSNRRVKDLNNYYDLFYNSALNIMLENEDDLSDFIDDEYYLVKDIIIKELNELVEERKEFIAA